MVTWGTTTVHTFGSPSVSTSNSTTFGSASPAPATGFGSPTPSAGGGLFGAAAPAPSSGGSLFGAPTSGSMFGSPAPAPFGSSTGGGLFGSAPAGGLFGSPAPAPLGGGLFGSPAPATGGLFGSSPAPGFFGSSSAASSTPFSFSSSTNQPGGTSLFGSSAPSMFGQPQQQQQQQQQLQGPQIPAQAALQAHLDASARQEELRVTSALERIHRAYQGTAVATETQSAPFTTVLYNPATTQMRQEQWLRGLGVADDTIPGQYQPIVPPQPAALCTADWMNAVIRNPEAQKFMPIPVVGAPALLARAQAQQEQASLSVQQLDLLRDSQECIRHKLQSSVATLEQVERRHWHLRKRMVDAMRKVELARCLNLPLQVEELQGMTKMMELSKHVDHQLRHAVGHVKERVHSTPLVRPNVTSMPDPEQLKQVLTMHRNALTKLAMDIQRDRHDLDLIQKRVSATAKVHLPLTQF